MVSTEQNRSPLQDFRFPRRPAALSQTRNNSSFSQPSPPSLTPMQDSTSNLIPASRSRSNSNLSIQRYSLENKRSDVATTLQDLPYSTSPSLPQYSYESRRSSATSYQDDKIIIESSTPEPTSSTKSTFSSSPQKPSSSTSLQQSPELKPSLKLLYSLLTRRDFIILVLPAVTLSILSGALPPLMTKVLGNAFNAYTAFNPSSLPVDQISKEAKDLLMKKILRSVWQLCALAAGTMILSTSMISVWICIGEKNARRLRENLYQKISERKMEWFDGGMGLDLEQEGESEKTDGTEESSGGGSVGAGGLMSKFAR